MFSITASGKERVIYSFKGYRDGGHPEGPLTAIDGYLYGTTTGTSKSLRIYPGTVFKVSLSGKETILHRFRNDRFRTARRGTAPSSKLLNLNGELYGATSFGGKHDAGIVFSLTYSGKERVLHSFPGGPDGGGPTGALTIIGNTLYGTAGGGTGPCYCGAVFALTL